MKMFPISWKKKSRRDHVCLSVSLIDILIDCINIVLRPIRQYGDFIIAGEGLQI